MLEIVRDAAVEVRKPTLFGELIIMIVYLPILTLEGIEGKLFRPMALTVIFALLGSVILSMTLMPVLASLRAAPRHGEARGASSRALAQGAVPARPRVGAPAHVAVVLGSALAVVLARRRSPRRGSAASSSRASPRARSSSTPCASRTCRSRSRCGTASRSRRCSSRKFPDEVKRVWTRTGTAEVATDPMGVELTDVFITLKPRERVEARARRRTSSSPR